jgi:hypothetical protein
MEQGTSTHIAVASTGNGIQTGKSASDPEEGIEGQYSFLDKIEEINRFEEKDLDNDDGKKYINE